MTAIILAAGRGSRFEESAKGAKSTNKCIMPNIESCPLTRSLRICKILGITKVIVVTGYKNDDICRSVNDESTLSNVHFIKNDLWDRASQDVSISVALNYIDTEDDLLILEGDSYYDLQNLRILTHSSGDYCVLTRRYNETSKSPVILSNGKFEYDPTHHKVPNKLSVESMQAWKISNKVIDKFKRSYQVRDCTTSESGIIGLNAACNNWTPVHADHPDNWINVNTIEDLRIASDVDWTHQY